MRHQKKKVTLSRQAGPRKALLRGLVESLVLYEKIHTTAAKAKAIRPLVEKLVTVAKKNTLAARRQLIASLYTASSVKKLMENLAPRYAKRNGGYTRITAVKNRLGDGAKTAVIEFV